VRGLYRTRLARVCQLEQETYILIERSEKAITCREMAKQTGLELPSQLERFLFGNYFQKIEDLFDSLSFVHPLSEFKILPPVKEAYKIVCLAFNYTDQANWVRFGKNPPTDGRYNLSKICEATRL
jgi:hypothetical protein